MMLFFLQNVSHNLPTTDRQICHYWTWLGKQQLQNSQHSFHTNLLIIAAGVSHYHSTVKIIN